MNDRLASEDFVAMFPTKPLSACLENVKVPAKIPRSLFLTDGKLPIISQESDFINGYWDNEADAIRVESPVVVFGDHTQVLKLIDFDFVVGADGVKILKPKAFLDAAFLRYFLEANPIPSLGYARHYRHISGINVPLPPPEEQKRIVAVLDQVFAALDRARAHAEANLADAETLFESSLDKVMAKHAAAGHKTTLGRVCGFENGDRGKNYPGRKAFVPEGVPFINAGHLDDGVIAWEDMNFIPEAHFHRLSKGRVQKDDLLFCLRGSLGKFGRVDREGSGAIASSLVIVRPGTELLTDFLGMYFKSGLCKAMIERYAGGAAQPNLSAGDLKKFEIILPSLNSQRSAVREHNFLLEATSKLNESYRNRLESLANLRQSLLQKAFAGELT